MKCNYLHADIDGCECACFSQLAHTTAMEVHDHKGRIWIDLCHKSTIQMQIITSCQTSW